MIELPLALFLSLNASPVPYTPAIGVVVAVAGGCATEDTALAHDELLEGFEGGYEAAGWTEVGTTVTENSDSSALTSNKPTGACDAALEVNYNAADAYAIWDRGTGIDLAANNVNFVFHVYIESMDTGDLLRLLSVGNSTTPGSSLSFQITIANSAGTISIFADGSVDSSSVNIVTGQWYKLTVHLNTTAGSSTFQVNEDTPLAFTRFNNAARYVLLGAAGGTGAGETGTFWYDVAAINTP